jgi:membrane AbrB-like protein
MVLTALISMFLAALISGVVARSARIDTCSAYFALLPGGLSEMANVGHKLGARSEAISLAHALRVALTVMIVPWAVLMLDTQTDIEFSSGHAVLDWPTLALLAAAAMAGAMVLRKVRLANPWMLGALAAVGLLAGMGFVEGRIPQPLMWIGQFLIGLAVGTRFKRDILLRLPRLALVSSGAVLALTAMMAGYAVVIRSLGASDLESLILAVSPGGFAEMTLTAQMLNLDVALVTGFHFVRAFAVNSLAAPMWHCLAGYDWFKRI